jgi:LPS O-antigen subunit length determinant protein (WzzB/FepE family)
MSEYEMLKLQVEQQFEASENRAKEQFDLILQHLKNAGQIAAARVRADATSDAGIEKDNEVGA